MQTNRATDQPVVAESLIAKTNAPETLLVLEDDVQIQKTLHRLFSVEGFSVASGRDGTQVMQALLAQRPTAIILDLMLPGISGREICRKIKASSHPAPVIVLSAISDVADKVLLLELGADDYVTKPFSPRELLARVQAAIRRSRKTTQTVPEVSFGDVTVDLYRMEVLRAGSPVPLTAHEFKLLNFFLANADRVLSREELLTEVWGFNCYPSTRTVDNQILKLRQKLEEDPANPCFFRTVHGLGYKFTVKASSKKQVG